MASLPSSDAIAFTITELTGDQRALVLTERALPYRPIAFSGKQRLSSTPYIGNPIKSVQVLGAEEEPFECGGMWKDRFIGETTGGSSSQSMAFYTQNGQSTQLLTCVDLVELVDDMRRKGQRVELQWGPIIRRGTIENFTHKWHNIHDVEWSIRIEITDQADPDVPAVLAQDTDNAQILGSLYAQVGAMAQQLLDAVGNVESGYLGEVNAQMVELSSLVDEFSDTVSNAVDTVMPIMDQQRRLAGLLTSIADSCDGMIQLVDSVPAPVNIAPSAAVEVSRPTATSSPTPVYSNPTTQTSATMTNGVPTGTIEGPTLVVEVFNRGMKTNARDIKYAALTSQYDLLKAVNPDIIASFTARDDTDLRDVSTQFYQTQDDWKSLMVFNGFTSSKLDAGDTVFIPKLVRPLDGSQ